MLEILKSNRKLWDLYTRREEYDTPFLDKYQRFPYYYSKNRNILKPEVSEFLIKNGFKIEYPNNSTFAVCLTHDVDFVQLSYPVIAYRTFQALKKMQINKSFKTLMGKASNKYNPLWNFTSIMDLESKYKAKSSFYFLSLDHGELDFNYKIEELRGELRTITDRGWEVGLHGGHRAYDNLIELKEEKERLEHVVGIKIIGYRNHYLRFKVPTTWQLLKEAGFKYDTTFGYADCVGFRNGMCHPFHPYDRNISKHIDIIEIPLTIMDSTFDTYMKLNLISSWELIKQLINIVEQYKGVITFLWHPSSMIDEMGELYERILQYCYDKNAWMTSAEEIYRYFQGRGL